MKHNKKLLWGIIVLISIVNIILLNRIQSAQDSIRKKNNENIAFKNEVENLRDDLKISFRESLKLGNHEINGIVLYYPQEACHICFDDLMLCFTEDSLFKNKITIYCEETSVADAVANFNDAFGTQYKCIVGSILFKENRNTLALCNVKNGIIIGIVTLYRKEKDYYKNIISLIKTSC